MRFAITLVVVAGCAKSATELYPFPRGEDFTCPVLDELPALRPRGPDLCLMRCTEETQVGVGCVDPDGNPVDLGRPARCADDNGEFSCFLVCQTDADCTEVTPHCNPDGVCRVF